MAGGELVIKTICAAMAYTVERRSARKSLTTLDLLKANAAAGFTGGNCVELKGKEATLKWISW